MIMIVDRYLEVYRKDLTNMVDHDVMEMACSSCLSWDLVCALTPLKSDVETVDPKTKYPELVPRDLLNSAKKIEELSLVAMSPSLNMVTLSIYSENDKPYRLPLPMQTCEGHILPGLRHIVGNLGAIPSKICPKSGISWGIFSSSARRTAERFDEFADKYGTWKSISGILTPSFI
jgi:hypothetical protein